VGKILVLGNGNLGQSMQDLYHDFCFLSRKDVDISNIDELKHKLESIDCSAIINTIAYTKVDLAEQEEDIATQINAYAPQIMAELCKKRNIPFVHSTDYVFDGTKIGAYYETDQAKPIGAYGRSKLLGDELIQKIGGKYLIFRTSWVYSEFGNNFMKTIIRLIGERDSLKIVSDQKGCPSYAKNLAKNSVQALQKACDMPKFPSGVYNLCSNNPTTWFDFAVSIAQKAKEKGIKTVVKEILPIATSDYPTAATRPQNSVLDCSKFVDIFNIELSNWERELEDCMVKYVEQSK
jgi:dTDP-4-dehydrorhamnose reductase